MRNLLGWDWTYDALQNRRKGNSENYAISTSGRNALPANDFGTSMRPARPHLHYLCAHIAMGSPLWCIAGPWQPITMLHGIISRPNELPTESVA